MTVVDRIDLRMQTFKVKHSYITTHPFDIELGR